jgi:hypothetical protein
LCHGVVRLSAFSLGPAHLKVGRRRRSRAPMQMSVAICIHDSKIMLCMLIQVFGRNPVAAGRSLAGERDIAFKHLVGIAPDLYIRTIAIKSLDPVRHPRAVMVEVSAVVAAARSFVWSWSHDTCLVAVDIVGPLSGGSVPLAPIGANPADFAVLSRGTSPRGLPP